MKNTLLLMVRQGIFPHGDTKHIKNDKRSEPFLNRGQAVLRAFVALSEAGPGFILFLLITVLPVSVLAGPALIPNKDFQYCADLSGNIQRGALHHVRLRGDVLEKCSASCGDLRVFSADGAEVPFVLIESLTPPEPQETYALEITDYAEHGADSVITFRLPEKHRAVTFIELNTRDTDFKKRAALSSSSDGKTWRPLAGDVIYDFSSQVSLRKTRIEFKKTDARYFRLKLTDEEGARKGTSSVRLKYEGLDFSVEGIAPKKIHIQGITALTALHKERMPVYDSKAIADIAPKSDKNGDTEIILKTGLPMERISFDVATPYFSRNASIYSQGAGEDQYRSMTRGTIYRFALDGRKEEQTFIDARLPKDGVSYKIVIENRGNAPLEVKSVNVSWARRNLYFIAPVNAGQEVLCFGNSSLQKPEYDIARFITRDNVSAHTPVPLMLGDVRTNAGFSPRMPGQKKAMIEKVILTAVVIVLVAGLGFWLFTLMKKMSQERPGGTGGK